MSGIYQAVLLAAALAAALLRAATACFLLRFIDGAGLSHLNTAAGRNFA